MTHKLKVEECPLEIFTEKAYLDYATYVILDRALPHLSDGFKPVQRRIVYAMSELHLHAGAKFKKSVRTVGDVMAKFHPHGDGPCYEAMVLMAQSFSYRYPLIEGQGNWGSADDPKSFAAMRYTEARLSRYAGLFLNEIEAGAIDWQRNFDGTLDEPRFLPAQVPNLLLNGATGIAVGMATDIPAHNLTEVLTACAALLENSDLETLGLLQYIQGPDFATGGEIVNTPEELFQMYETGYGTLRLRARYQIDKTKVIITQLPYQVSVNKVMEQIAAQVRAKKLPMLMDLRDESDQESPVRLVLELKTSFKNPELLMQHLFSSTELEKTHRANFNVIGITGKPMVFGLKALLLEWLEFRLDTLKRRFSHRAQQIAQRLTLLEGLDLVLTRVALLVQLITESEDPLSSLMAEFGLSEIQARFILEVKLKQIGKMQREILAKERFTLLEEDAHLQKLLNSPSALKQYLKKELLQIASDYGDERRSILITRQLAKPVDFVEKEVESCTIFLSKAGWVKLVKGHALSTEGAYRTGDSFLASLQVSSDQGIYFSDQTGRVYNVSCGDLPTGRGVGEALNHLLVTEANTRFVGLFSPTAGEQVLWVNATGYGFMLQDMAHMKTKMRSGKQIMLATEEALPPCVFNEKALYLALATQKGKVLILERSLLPVLNKGRGTKLIQLKKDDRLVGTCTLSAEDAFYLETSKGPVLIEAVHWRRAIGKRGNEGSILKKIKEISAIKHHEASQK